MLISLLNNEIDEYTYLLEHNAKILYKSLPRKIYGFVLRYRNIHLIVINRSLSDDKKRRTILHEFAHLELNHLDKRKELIEFSIENAEDEADAYIKYLMEVL